MAVEADHSYQQLQSLLAAISRTQNAHQKLLLGKSQDGGKGMLAAVPDMQVKLAGLKQQQQQLLPIVQQRLSTMTAQQPQLADL